MEEFMKYKVYPEYKETYLGWLKNIPSHWELKRLKYLGNAIIGLTYSPDDIVEKEEGVLVLRSSNVQNKKLAFQDTVYVSKEIPMKLKTQVGDILICSRNGSRALIGKNAMIDESSKGMSFGAFMTIFRSPYNQYLSKIFNSTLFEYQSGTFLTSTVNQLTTGNLNSFEIPFPSEREREQIATFLDHETAKIDTLIEKQRKLIKLLKEKRQAVISHAVTKGLNPDAPMKDSGVEWLGEVPEHWGTGRFVYQLDLLLDGTHFSPESYPEGDYLYITAKNIKEDGFDFSNISYISKTDHETIYSRCSVKKGDVLYIKDGATAGVAMVNHLEEPFSMLSSVALIRPNLQKLHSQYICYLLNASIFKNEMLNRLNGGAMTRFTVDAISHFPFIIPPLSDQLEICENLDKVNEKYKKIIKNADKQILLLQERRTALISAAVTGKIDVRDWKKPGGIS